MPKWKLLLFKTVLFNSIDADESGSVNEEEYKALLSMMSTSEGAEFPGSFKRMLDAVDS